jgi:hypothetical protein
MVTLDGGTELMWDLTEEMEFVLTRCHIPDPCEYFIEPNETLVDRAPKYLRKHRNTAPLRMSRTVSHNIRRGRLPREFKGRKEMQE